MLVSALALLVAPSGSAAGAWQDAGAVAVGGVLVQVVAQLVGTGLGLLLRPPALASAATVVLPLGLWFLLGAVDALRPAQDWLTPFATAEDQLSGRMDAGAWTRWLVVVLLWPVGLNAAGAIVLQRRRSSTIRAPA